MVARKIRFFKKIVSRAYRVENKRMAISHLFVFFYAVDLRGIEPLPQQCECCVMPFYYGPSLLDNGMYFESVVKYDLIVSTKMNSFEIEIKSLLGGKEKADELNKLVIKAQVAKDKNMLPELGNATRQIGRLNEYVKQLTPIRDNLARIGDYLTKIHKNSAYLIEDAKNELELKKDLYKSVTSGNKALTSAMKLFNGDPEKKLMVEQSMEYLKEDIATKLANMKKAISYYGLRILK